MKIVLDTNVLVAALLTPFGPSAQVLQLLLSDKLRLCYDNRILTEYRNVLGRPKFGFDGELVGVVLEFLEQGANWSSPRHGLWPCRTRTTRCSWKPQPPARPSTLLPEMSDIFLSVNAAACRS